jgi:hypothetical protein
VTIGSKDVTFRPDDRLKIGEGKVMLPLPEVLGLQQTTIVTGELVVPFETVSAFELAITA